MSDVTVGQRDHWIRLFNRLEKACSDAIDRNPDDDALAAAHRAVMRDAHAGPASPGARGRRLRAMHTLVGLGVGFCAVYDEPDKWLIGRCDCDGQCADVRAVLDVVRGRVEPNVDPLVVAASEMVEALKEDRQVGRIFHARNSLEFELLGLLNARAIADGEACDGCNRPIECARADRCLPNNSEVTS